MKWSQTLIPTLKEDPQDAESTSHKLMVRAGMIRRLTAGTYSYLPLGLRVLEKISNVIREELNAQGAQEVLLPAIHPPELWRKTGRYELLGEVLIKFRDRHGREMMLGPTHEEVITSLVAGEVRSYRELPLILYQIQTKFRDEPRPRFGVMRSCEFIMKDAYSFDCDLEGLEQSYKKMYGAYCRIFERCGLKFIPVEADPGFMGGNVSHEFMVPAEIGEDEIVICSSCRYSASVMVAGCKNTEKAKTRKQIKKLPLAEVDTPGIATVEKVSQFLNVDPSRLVKTLIYKADGRPIALLIRGDYDANETKLKNFLKCETLELADEKAIDDLTGGPLGFSGPVGLKGIHMIADLALEGMVNFITGANKRDTHLINVNLKRDFEVNEFGDFRVITQADPCPKCNKKITINKAIEIGHTFKLGTKYSKALDANFLDKNGTSHPIVMGCYGIGVNRIAASLIETSNDGDGIIWPLSVSPYEVILLALNVNDKTVKKNCDDIYKRLLKEGVEVLYDDRDERAGIKFKDADLIGMPIQIVIGEKNARKGKVEVKLRRTKEVNVVNSHDAMDVLRNIFRRKT